MSEIEVGTGDEVVTATIGGAGAGSMVGVAGSGRTATAVAGGGESGVVEAVATSGLDQVTERWRGALVKGDVVVSAGTGSGLESFCPSVPPSWSSSLDPFLFVQPTFSNLFMMDWDRA